jgi:hypothetical protein
MGWRMNGWVDGQVDGWKQDAMQVKELDTLVNKTKNRRDEHFVHLKA